MTDQDIGEYVLTNGYPSPEHIEIIMKRRLNRTDLSQIERQALELHEAHEAYLRYEKNGIRRPELVKQLYEARCWFCGVESKGIHTND